MNCREIQLFKDAYADGELDAARSMEIELHLSDCRECAQAFELVDALKSVFANSEDLYFKAPARLEKRIHVALNDETRRTHRISWISRPWLSIAIPAAAAALLALVFLPTMYLRSRDDALIREVESSHARSLMASHLTDVASSDQHTVKPWFQGKIDFAPPVADFAEQGYPLLGGRLDYLEDHIVAALVYQRHKHVINVFLWPAGPGSDETMKVWARHGYNLIRWRKFGMNYWVVSDLNAEELKDFAKLLNR